MYDAGNPALGDNPEPRFRIYETPLWRVPIAKIVADAYFIFQFTLPNRCQQNSLTSGPTTRIKNDAA